MPVASDRSESQRNAPARWIAERVWLGGDQLSPMTAIEARDRRFTEIEPGEPGEGMPLGGVVIPGLVNAHSHAFHRLLRGRTHHQGGDFWLWRERMYEIAEDLTPETYEEIATAVYIEMAMAGITTVGEFHYVHHQPGGTPYDDPNEMGHSLVRAARRAGIRICLLDVGYFRAGFDDRPLHPYQERFSDGSVDDWLDRVDELSASYQGAEDVVVGVAPHSVRAVPFDALRRVEERVGATMPVHVHVSEQQAENRDCLEATGKTPVALLKEAGLLSPMTTLVHATHLNAADVEAIGEAGCNVCYCATTERDLADGLGPASELVAAGASLSLGSDSHAVIDLFEEARGVEMHQRLRTGRRGVMDPVVLLDAATAGGAQSLGFPAPGLSEDRPADFVVLDPDTPRLAGLDLTSVDSIVFAATAADVTDTVVGGRSIVSEGRHPAWDA
ncbi:MAG TPA: formimidoylglutamate deiminase, partial [Acidimicrobiia bacterium]|nr:formimidoylglutamate deiminase [Acidimicrobiia bacterium]